MAVHRLRLAAALVSAALLVLAAWAGIRSDEAAPLAFRGETTARAIDAQPGTALRDRRLQRAAVTWRGGPITASTGEVVEVYVSDALPLETTPESWAEFLVGLAHGPELQRVASYHATLAEVQDICGDRALGCYSRDRMVSLGEVTIDGTTPEEVVRHEYGHHVALYRDNAPWRAIDWGPKNWATAAGICPRVVRGEAFPGDEGRNYEQNPGEAWAEVYRLLAERKAGITTGTWPIIAPSFYPDEAALLAAERDVLEPWAARRPVSFRRTFTKRGPKTWSIPLSTPLDGNLRITAALPKGGRYEVALVGPNRRSVLQRASSLGPQSKRIETTVCGQRSLSVRVAMKARPGRVVVSVSTP